MQETDAHLLDSITALRVWRRDGQRAPHKPLLVLLTLGRVHRGEQRLVAFPEIEKALRDLIADFGPPRQPHPQYPFWHLQSDGLWEIPHADRLGRTPGKGVSLREARELEGGFPVEIWQRLRDDPSLLREAAQQLLAAHFPSSLHEEILDRVGLGDLDDGGLRRAQRRDPRFRIGVLRAYGYRCAVCGYDGRLDNTPIGLEAAHVRWWAAGGPDDVTNAMALCVLHHKAFDLGVIGVTSDWRVKVAQAFNGGRAAHAVVSRFAGRPLLRPHHGGEVGERHRQWHDREVFRAPAAAPPALAAEEPDWPYDPS